MTEQGSVLRIATLIILALFGFMLFLFHRWGVFSADPSASNTLLLAAIVALAGTMVSSVIALVSVGLRQSREQDAAKDRRVDVSIRAAGLLGEDASRDRKAGALLALANLGEYRFALNLLRELWPEKEVTTDCAAWLVGQPARVRLGRLGQAVACPSRVGTG